MKRAVLARISLLVPIALIATSTAGCFDLDGFVWNPVNCKNVDPKSDACTTDHVCTPCDKPLPFDANGIPSSSVHQVTVKIKDGQTLDSYFITSGGERANTVVVYAHGNFGGVEHYLNRVKLLYDMGVSIFAIDYRSFGKSSTTTEPDEPTFMDDVHKTRAALDPFVKGIAGARVVDYGYSAGALAAVEMAVTSKPCGLILEAPFASVQSFSDTSTFVAIPQSFITTGSWDNVAKMPKVHAPVLQLHGADDDFVQLSVGEQVFDAANEPKKLIVVPGAGHGNGGNDIPTVLGSKYGDDVETFLDTLRCE